MKDARWLEVDDDIASATEHFSRSIEIFERGGFSGQGLDAYVARMALMQAMQSGYSSLESALERILEILGEEKPTGSNYHSDLLRRVAREIPGDRPAIIDGELLAAIDDARRFGHVARKSYDSFQVEGAETAIGSAVKIRDMTSAAIDLFRKKIDPDYP